mmetsp:Transcript_16113/g.46152  ORF Transcript_16113/g.46152 Transcript_16113/m.46152 type:complete len:245 (-) Transcript_16113:2678-3412(-)
MSGTDTSQRAERAGQGTARAERRGVRQGCSRYHSGMRVVEYLQIMHAQRCNMMSSQKLEFIIAPIIVQVDVLPIQLRLQQSFLLLCELELVVVPKIHWRRQGRRLGLHGWRWGGHRLRNGIGGRYRREWLGLGDLVTKYVIFGLVRILEILILGKGVLHNRHFRVLGLLDYGHFLCQSLFLIEICLFDRNLCIRKHVFVSDSRIHSLGLCQIGFVHLVVSAVIFGTKRNRGLGIGIRNRFVLVF